MADPEVVVLGSGPNGLTAACLLAEAGLRVLVLEAAQTFGGGVHSAELTLPDFQHDVCSAFYPLFAPGPIGKLPLGRHGLEWLSFDRPFGGGTPDGPGFSLGRTAELTVERLARDNPEDAAGFRALWEWWRWGGPALLDLLFNPLGAPGPLLKFGLKLGQPRRLLELVRLLTASARTVADEHFAGEDARVWYQGSALHSDLAPEATGGGAFSLAFLGLGQQGGMPIPRGGAAAITSALLRYLESLGGRALAGQPATELVIRDRRAVAVRTPTDEIPAGKAILATVEPQRLFLRLVGEQHLPTEFVRRIRQYRWGVGTLKLDLALAGLPPFRSEALRGTGVLHLAASSEALALATHAAGRGYLPAEPFLIAGLQTIADPSRAPAGRHTLWAECHVPYAIRGDAAGEIRETDWAAVKERFADRALALFERFAPGTGELVLARSVLSPVDLERANPNLVRGDITGGSFEPDQQLVFRPVPGWFYHRTPVRGLYLSGAATHPGGGVHGAPGANAARVLLADLKLRSLTGRVARLRQALEPRPRTPAG